MPIEWKRQRQASYYHHEHHSDGRWYPAQPLRYCNGGFQLGFDFQFMTKTFERLQQLVCAVISLPAIFPQRFADDLLKLSGRVREIFRERQRLRLKNRRHHLLWCVASEWRTARYHFVKDYAETPDIGAFINLRAVRLLGRHVTNGSHDRPQIGLNQRQRFVSRRC